MTVTTRVAYEVDFDLADEDTFIAPGRKHNVYVRVDRIIVRIRPDYSSAGYRPPSVTANGYRCRKDGTPGAFGHHLESVDLISNDPWIERAWATIGITPEERT